MSRRLSAGLVVRVAVRTVGELSITLGTLTLLFVVWQLWWTDIEANRDQSRLTSGLEQQWTTVGAPAPDASGQPLPAVVTEPVTPPQLVSGPTEQAPAGEAFAILRIPSLGETYKEPILAGTGTATLQRGLGHYDGTAGPGEVGNFAVAGHRTTYGAPLSRVAELRVGDPVIVQTADRYYVYRVASAEIVSPQDVAVIAAVPGRPDTVATAAVMTLTTCHPKYSARQRYVVHSSFVASVATAGDVSAVLAAG